MLPLAKFNPALQDSLNYNHSLYMPKLPTPKILVFYADSIEPQLEPYLKILSGVADSSIGTLTSQKYEQAQLSGDVFRAAVPLRESSKRHKSVLFYSGGIESSLCSLSAVNQDLVYVEGIKELAQRHKIHLIEPLLLLIAKVAGYTGCTIGSIISDPKTEVGKLYGYSAASMFSWANALGMTVHLPFFTQTKLDVHKTILTLGLRYHSCDHAHDYCGECFSCFQSEVMRKMLGQQPFKPMRKELRDKYIAEINHTRLTGEDKWYGENSDILDYEQRYGFNINTFWD